MTDWLAEFEQSALAYRLARRAFHKARQSYVNGINRPDDVCREEYAEASAAIGKADSAWVAARAKAVEAVGEHAVKRELERLDREWAKR